MSALTPAAIKRLDPQRLRPRIITPTRSTSSNGLASRRHAASLAARTHDARSGVIYRDDAPAQIDTARQRCGETRRTLADAALARGGAERVDEPAQHRFGLGVRLAYREAHPQVGRAGRHEARHRLHRAGEIDRAGVVLADSEVRDDL